MCQYPDSVTAEKGGGALVVSLETSGPRALAWAEVGGDAVPRGEPVRDGLSHVGADCVQLARLRIGLAFVLGEGKPLAAGRHFEEDRSRPLLPQPQEVLVDPMAGDLKPDGGVQVSMVRRYISTRVGIGLALQT